MVVDQPALKKYMAMKVQKSNQSHILGRTKLKDILTKYQDLF